MTATKPLHDVHAAPRATIRQLTDREVNTILCALRGMYNVPSPSMHRVCDPVACDHFEDDPPLVRAEADALAEEFSLGMFISTVRRQEVSNGR